MRGLIKTVWAIGIISWHLFTSYLVHLFVRDPRRRRRIFLALVHRRALWLAKAVSLEIELVGAENRRPGQNYLIVANHLSYLDAIIFSSLGPAAFVTSIEMKNTPVLGTITDLGGCLYVERRSKENIHKEVAEVSAALKEGFNVVVFPEATSTNGEQVKQFKRPLFLAAVDSGKPVLPMVVEYAFLDGEPVTRANRDILCWYGDMTFGGHFVRLASRRSIKVRLKILPEIPVTAGATRDTLMEESYAKVVSNYRPIV